MSHIFHLLLTNSTCELVPICTHRIIIHWETNSTGLRFSCRQWAVVKEIAFAYNWAQLFVRMRLDVFAYFLFNSNGVLVLRISYKYNAKSPECWLTCWAVMFVCTFVRYKLLCKHKHLNTHTPASTYIQQYLQLQLQLLHSRTTHTHSCVYKYENVYFHSLRACIVWAVAVFVCLSVGIEITFIFFLTQSPNPPLVT